MRILSVSAPVSFYHHLTAFATSTAEGRLVLNIGVAPTPIVLSANGEALYTQGLNGELTLFAEVYRDHRCVHLYSLRNEPLPEWFVAYAVRYAIDYERPNSVKFTGSCETPDECSRAGISGRLVGDVRTFVPCVECESFVLHDDSPIPLCPTCLEQSEDCSRCDDCGRVHAYDDLTYVGTVPAYVCSECLYESYYQCGACDRWFLRESIPPRTVNGQDQSYCPTCHHRRAEQGEIFMCDECEEWYTASEYAGDGLCRACAASHLPSGLHEYGYKPTPIFQYLISESEGSRLYLGVENELSFSGTGVRQSFLASVQNTDLVTDEVVYFKEDSSLDNGVETVSHPCTLNYFLSCREALGEFLSHAKDAGARAEEGEGLHVHVNRTGMTRAHENRFGAFFYIFYPRLLPVTRREPTTYCQSLPAPACGDDVLSERDASRYHIVNFLNRRTIEVRLFQATTDASTYLACIELVHAVYRFTKRATTITALLQKPESTWLSFLAYLASDMRYHDALSLLLEDALTMVEHEQIRRAQRGAYPHVHAHATQLSA